MVKLVTIVKLAHFSQPSMHCLAFCMGSDSAENRMLYKFWPNAMTQNRIPISFTENYKRHHTFSQQSQIRVFLTTYSVDSGTTCGTEDQIIMDSVGQEKQGLEKSVFLNQ